MYKVSVIVPIYQVEKYLRKCIDSIINQTYKNLEIILVDDGSPDLCGKICDEYAEKDVRIKVIHKENGGLSDARNAGLDIACGDYIVFVDSDDYIAHDMIEKLYESLVNNDADMALCSFEYVDEDGNIIKKEGFTSPIKNEVLSKKEMLCKLLENKHWYYSIACNKLYKNNLMQDIRFPKEKIHEDEFIAHKSIGMCETISCIQEPLYFYVQRDNSIMGKGYNARNLDCVEAYFERTIFFIKNGMEDLIVQSVNRGLENFLRGYHEIKNKDIDFRKRVKYLKKLYKKLYFKIIVL